MLGGFPAADPGRRIGVPPGPREPREFVVSEKRRIVVAMSGGVDSSVAAALLRDEGHDVVGLFMRNGAYREDGVPQSGSCCSLNDANDARRVADALGVPFYSVNFEEAFGRLIDYFADEYYRGRTPNPCVRCNRDLKFGLLLDYADAIGADGVATGHYARRDDAGGRPRLLRAVDADKDQSYVLFPLSPRQLARTRLPLGGLTKTRVRELARAYGLPTSEKAESMEICFVPDNDYRAFLAGRAAERGVPAEAAARPPGRMVDLDGRALGTHAGIQHFTVGQRHGLGLALGRPAYVVRLDAATNEVVVGFEDDLLSTGLVATEVNWVSIDAPAPGRPLPCRVKIRARSAAVPATLEIRNDGAVELRFERPQRAVTPGQAAVFYDQEVVLGGGWIESALGAAARPREQRFAV